MSKIIFKHELSSTMGKPISTMKITDDTKDNLEIDDAKFTLDKESIKEIKKLVKNPALYKGGIVLPAPIADGTTHYIMYSNGKNSKRINCTNIWYWSYKEAYEGIKNIYKISDINFTIFVVGLISQIQGILDKNKIKYSIANKK